MFSKLFVILALAFVATAYQGVSDVYEKTQYGDYHPFQELIKSTVGYPYFQYPYYGFEGQQGYITPDVYYTGSYPYQYSSYYPQYISSWLKYPYFAKYYQQTYNPVDSYYHQGQNIPYPFWGKTTGGFYGYGSKFYTGVPDYLAY